MGGGRKRLSGAKRREIKKKWKARTFLERGSESSGDDVVTSELTFNPETGIYLRKAGNMERERSEEKRSISTKIHDNALQKMTISDMSGLPLCTFPLMCSISPAGTDESNCHHLITLHQAGVPGGLLAFMESPLTEPVTLIVLQDQGFRKYGFDHANRQSFTDYEDDLQQRSHMTI